MTRMDIVKLEKLGQRYQVSKTRFLASAPWKKKYVLYRFITLMEHFLSV